MLHGDFEILAEEGARAPSLTYYVQPAIEWCEEMFEALFTSR